MSDQDPKFNKVEEPRESRPSDPTHEEKSITGSGQTIGLEPGEDFIAPTMALDSLQSDPDDQ